MRNPSRALLLAATLALAAIVLLAGCGAAGSSASASTATSTPIPTVPIVYPTATPRPVVLVQQTVLQFCQALSDQNLSQAYAYLSPHYQQTVGSAAQLPNILPRWGKLSGCSEFGQGGFVQVNGDHASDKLNLMMSGGAFGATTMYGGVNLVQAGAAWQIDSIEF